MLAVARLAIGPNNARSGGALCVQSDNQDCIRHGQDLIARASSSVTAFLKNRQEACAPEQQAGLLHANTSGSDSH
jgi:hypothetical protein